MKVTCVLWLQWSVAVLALGVLAAGTPAGAQDEVSFLAQRAFQVGPFPISVTVGDFNADGRQDLATANEGSATVSVLLGRGDGTFQTARDFGVGSGPSSVTVGDFNADGRQDLATANVGSVTVSVLLGWGDGTFQAARDFRVGIGTFSVTVGDFNADGRQDLATANEFADTVSVLLGQGDGTFQAARDFRVVGAVHSVTVGDFNADGRQDLATANEGSATASVLLGQGDGTFQAARDFRAAFSPFSVTVGDFNADGRQDLATANRESRSASVLLGQGDGTFQAARDFGVGGRPASVTVGDFNADGRQDLAMANETSATATVLLGRGDGTFQTARDFGAGSSPFSVTVGDFNADGRPDLATANVGSDTVSILLNTTTPPVVNDFVSFTRLLDTFETSPDVTGCPANFVATFRFSARLTNRSFSPPLIALTVKVNTLTNGNLLQNADAGPGGVGAALTVPQKEGFADGVLSPGESVDVPFAICLRQPTPFQLMVDVLGAFVLSQVTILGNEPIFLAGRDDVTIPPLEQPFLLGRHGFVAPDFVEERFPPGFAVKSGGIVKVLSPAQGGVDFFNAPSATFFPPEGDTSIASSLDALGGISGYMGPAGALVGVFLDNTNPAALIPPPTIDFSAPESRDVTSFSPALRQIFFIGDGIIRTGALQEFIVPQGATRLFLGIPDGFSFVGAPGFYEDNDGEYRITLSVSP